MEVGQGPNWGCSAKEKKVAQTNREHFKSKLILPVESNIQSMNLQRTTFLLWSRGSVK
jgi:hypothetical protein